MCKMHNNRLVQIKRCIFRSIIMDIVLYILFQHDIKHQFNILSWNLNQLYRIHKSLAPLDSIDCACAHTYPRVNCRSLLDLAQTQQIPRYYQKGFCFFKIGVTWHLSASDNVSEIYIFSDIHQKKNLFEKEKKAYFKQRK